jgi:hypothetical protein
MHGVAVRIVLICVTLAFASAAQAADTARPEGTHSVVDAPLLYEVRIGLMAHDIDGLWSGDRKEDGFDLGMELVFNRAVGSILNGIVRPNVGFTLNNRGDTSKVYAGFLWRWSHDSGWFVDLGLGAALHNGELESRERDEKQLGSRVLFRIPIELGYQLGDHHHVSLYFEHISNAWLVDENEGMDLLGIRYGYRF